MGSGSVRDYSEPSLEPSHVLSLQPSISAIMFFDSWTSLGRILIVAVIAYAGLVIILRVFGKRMLSKMNAFDLVVTVALGSTLSAVITSRDLPLANGLTALLVLVGLQFILAMASSRSAKVENLIKSEPTLLFFRGQYLEDALKKENVSESAVLTYIRAQGIAEVTSVEAVVLEADGSMNVIERRSGEDPSSLQDVKNYPQNKSTTSDQ